MIFAVRRTGRAPQVAAWLAAQAEIDLFLSVITLGETEREIRLRERDTPDFAIDLRLWLDRTMSMFGDRILEINPKDARLWGELAARIGHPRSDLMITALALARDGVVVTRNVADFKGTGVRLVDPL